jgi:hypothetical protein
MMKDMIKEMILQADDQMLALQRLCRRCLLMYVVPFHRHHYLCPLLGVSLVRRHRVCPLVMRVVYLLVTPQLLILHHSQVVTLLINNRWLSAVVVVRSGSILGVRFFLLVCCFESRSESVVSVLGLVYACARVWLECVLLC